MRRPVPGLDALGALLDLCDSQIVNRSRYLSAPMRKGAEAFAMPAGKAASKGAS